MADFSYAHMSALAFSHANIKGVSFTNTDLREANFLLVNLQKADLTNTTITNNQLQSALTIRDAKLPNGTLGRGRNLIKNGDANCNISLADHWQIKNGNIVVVPSKEDRSKCQFSLQSVATEATMCQQIDLVSIWNSSFWIFSNVELHVHMSSGVLIELSGRNRKITSKLRILIINDKFSIFRLDYR
jgi:uncharacterized protein YjbI with pentapeptide repeats